MTATPPHSKIPVEKMERYKKLKEVFSSKFGHSPDFYGRAPGRVNLIGEHIDYCGYAVLPMAIEQDVSIAVAPNDLNVIRMVNTDPKYSEYSCSTKDINIDKGAPKWYHYILCGYRGVTEHFSMDAGIGMDLAVDGNIPCSAGLSSSSALVCCAGLVTMQINKKQMTKLELSDVCQHCERYIGTEGGGMDQSISFLAMPGTAKLIEFNPIRATDVQLPEGAVFVVSNSCVEMHKAATSHFNIRVVECRLATQVIAKSKGLPWREIKRLGDLQQKLGVNLEDMLAIVKELLHQQPYSKDEVCDILGVTAEELVQTSLSQNTLTVEEFQLYDRAMHVYSEANRVLNFKATCDKQPDNALAELGRLMNESHASCRDHYQCSCDELDVLTCLSVKSGALGSRLTGAGWGGCAVSMVPANQVKDFMSRIEAGYYAVDTSRQAKVKESLFVSQPGGGAAIYFD